MHAELKFELAVIYHGRFSTYVAANIKKLGPLNIKILIGEVVLLEKSRRVMRFMRAWFYQP
jgi:hypothetical protein